MHLSKIKTHPQNHDFNKIQRRNVQNCESSDWSGSLSEHRGKKTRCDLTHCDHVSAFIIAGVAWFAVYLNLWLSLCILPCSYPLERKYAWLPELFSLPPFDFVVSYDIVLKCLLLMTYVCLCLCMFFFVYLQPTRTSMSITFTHIAVALWEPSHSQPTLIWAEVRVSMWMCPICGMNLPWLMHLCTDLSFQPSAGFGICLAASRHSFTLPCILGQNMQKLCSSSNKC